MINSINSINFKALPKYLRGAKIETLNAKGLTDIIKDAGKKADVKIKTWPKRVYENNYKIFDSSGKITQEGVEYIREEFGEIETCRELRDALAEVYKKYKGQDGILDMIV